MMSNRLSVPSELRRRVLVEAGHRCAIHTCRHPDIDIHHIIPWEQCHEHSYDNLIALCPNCHRRAGSDEIDRKSLRMYKARIAASFGISSHNPDAEQIHSAVLGVESTQGWTVKTLEESHKDYPPYEVELEYPSFNKEDTEIEQLNLLQRARAVTGLAHFRSVKLDSMLPEKDWKQMASVTSTLSESFEVATFTPAIVSIRYSVFHYGAGAAHPNHYTEVVNFQREPLIPLSIWNVFQPDSVFLRQLSDYCVARLAAEKGEPTPSESVRNGAGPELKNFANFNLIETGLLIAFDEYQVGCYADGAYHIFVPSKLLCDYVRPGCRVRELWQG